MSTKVKDIFNEFAPKIVESLQESANKKVIQNLQSITKIDLPNDLKQLYKEYNGLNLNSITNFAYGVHFILIEESTKCIELYNSLKKEDLNDK